MSTLLIVLAQMICPTVFAANAAVDQQFEQLAAKYVDESPALSPVSATLLGDVSMVN